MDSVKKRHLQMPEILLIAGACFAMAMVGFFLAVYFLKSHTSPTESITTLKAISPEEKAKAMEGADAQANPAPAPTQVYEDDPNAAAKLKAMGN